MAVPDHETAAAQNLLAEEAGVEAEFASATAFAGLIRLARTREWAGRSAVVVITAGGPS